MSWIVTEWSGMEWKGAEWGVVELKWNGIGWSGVLQSGTRMAGRNLLIDFKEKPQREKLSDICMEKACIFQENDDDIA